MKRSFSAIYLAILSGILLSILIINGALEVNRMKNGFYLLLEREAAFLLQHFERNIKEAFSSLEQSRLPFLGMEGSIAEYLVEAAYRVDQMDQEKVLSPVDLHAVADQYLLTSIEIYNPKGIPLQGWPPQPAVTGKRLFLQELVEKKRSVVIDPGEDRGV